MTRTDIHKPSAIKPQDYVFVAFQYYGSSDLGAVLAMKEEREKLAQHMTLTGAKFSGHQHGGICHICGCGNISYACVFFHQISNSYIVTGADCAEKMSLANGDFNGFQRNIRAAIEAQAGKRKAQAVLSNQALSSAWDIYAADYDSLPKTGALPERVVDGETIPAYQGQLYFEELTIRDIVSKLVKYGSISDKQTMFLRSLVERIGKRAAIEAQRAAERDAAAPCPKGRVTITGTILKIEERESQFGVVDKMTVKANEGFIVWATVPRNSGAAKGEKITFKATVTPSDRDPKFGFAKRPMILQEAN